MATKKPSPKLSGKARKKKSEELFANIGEYVALGFKVGNGLQRILDTLVHAFSDKKAHVTSYSYSVVTGQPARTATYTARVETASGRKFQVDAVVSRDAPDFDSFVLRTPRKKPAAFKFDEQGLRDLVDTAMGRK